MGEYQKDGEAQWKLEQKDNTTCPGEDQGYTGPCLENRDGGCIAQGVDYFGYHRGNQTNAYIYRDIDTPADCQRLCATVHGCNVFTYLSNQRWCILKWGRRNEISAPGIAPTFYFGPKSCPSLRKGIGEGMER